jgi:hypothetical protein
MYLAMCVLEKKTKYRGGPSCVCVCVIPSVVCCAQYMVGVIELSTLYKCLLI